MLIIKCNDAGKYFLTEMPLIVGAPSVLNERSAVATLASMLP